uniref:ANK_REP_REGION domain-containing protein n=1 Tax=Macrostomum lignano TaxID=282301 RepID=A0A1I8J7J8_9PLAT
MAAARSAAPPLGPGAPAGSSHAIFDGFDQSDWPEKPMPPAEVPDPTPREDNSVQTKVRPAVKYRFTDKLLFMDELLIHASDKQFKEALKFAVSKDESALKLHEDEHSRTAAHYAAMSSEGEELLKTLIEKAGKSCLDHRDSNSATPLHYAAQNYRIEQFRQLHPDAEQELRSSKMRDQAGDTLAHYAARNTTDESVLRSALHENLPAMLWENNRGHTVLHVAVEHCGDELVNHLLEQAREHLGNRINEEKIAVDNDGDTLAHCAARNENPGCQNDEVFEEVKTFFGNECLSWKDSGDKYADEEKNSYLHIAAMSEKCDTFARILEILKQASTEDECIKLISEERNDDGQTVLHIVAGGDKKLLKAIREKLTTLKLNNFIADRDGRGRNMLFYACMAWNYSLLKILQSQSDAFKEVDADENSLLHAMFLNHRVDELVSSEEFFQNVAFLAEKMPNGVNHENNLKKNFLHCSQLKEKVLIKILSAAVDSPILKKVFLNKDGVHVVHEFASRYNLENLIEPLASIANAEKAELRSKVVERGPNKGANCLHFACQAGHQANIAYLTKNGLKITDMDHDGLTCIDYARDADQLKKLVEAQGFEPSEACCLFDPLHRAVKLPDRPAAMQHIARIVDQVFELIPSCIRLIIQLKRKIKKHDVYHDQLKSLASKVISIAVNTLDQLYANSDDKDRELLFNYIRGELRGLKYSIDENENSRATICCSGESQQYTVLELVEIAECEDLFATDCIYKLAKEEWKKAKNCGSPTTHFGFSLATYIVFMLYFAWFVTDFKTTFNSFVSDAILTAFALLFLVLEVFDFTSLPPKAICCGGRSSKCSMYWRNVYNVFDFIALLLLWLGIVWKWSIFGNPGDVTAYACQCILSTSFLFCGFRSVAFLSSWQKTGHVIVMLKKLMIGDLGPFLAISAIIFLSFGVFFFNLLFPSTTAQSSETQAEFYWWRVMLQIFTMPFDLLFTNFERIQFDTPRSDLSQEVGSVANAIGLSWFRNLTLFVFLLLVNIVMVNLLIALFNLRVSTLHSKAIGIWRQGYFELLREYQGRAELYCCCINRKCSREKDADQGGPKYSATFLQYLYYQALLLRRIRPKLSREVEKNRSGFEQLKAHCENNLARVHAEISEDLTYLKRRIKEVEHAQNLPERDRNKARQFEKYPRPTDRSQSQQRTAAGSAERQPSQQSVGGARPEHRPPENGRPLWVN